MEKYDELSEENNDGNQFGIPLMDLFPPLWRSRWIIIGVTVVASGLGLWQGIHAAKYQSEGFLQFGGAIPIPLDRNMKDKEPPPGIMLADYKRYAAFFSTSGRFTEFIQQNKLEATPGVDGLRKVFSSAEEISKLMQPVFPFTKLDAKELMDQPKDGGNNVIGLRIVYAAGSGENAQRMVGLLGRYAMDSITYMIYSDVLRFKYSEITALITKLDNDIIENREKLDLYKRKSAALKQIVMRYPESANQTSRQVISVTEDNARYLSPVTQLMTTEVDTAITDELIYHTKREQQKNILLREYYGQAKILLDNTKSGETVLRGLESVKLAVFKTKDLKDKTTQEVYNKITIDNQLANNLYLEKSRFIAGPSLPEHRSTRLSAALLRAFAIGLFGSIIVVLGRAWWIKNRSKFDI
ncbi:lipopolysaccharide biosynthesis protein [Janthinobacterium sp. GW460P]|uniref:lipopolysaccharide biosynthesis protein n=1 Tax=unclassified Janthinobacterium TaxID=2610881 RepID=UPI000A31EE60|nr:MULTISPECIES: lipopolysaccharide biosynthesis protein [unclassified Janthinobacterium]MCC7701831.1 lipopolysaccharide biosynthesis protein [Janthinobacterium sp. GW460P]MCC7707339.1 lipopolysaccharide biosynthesis protein [Janthinobacterium sp. GW460W]